LARDKMENFERIGEALRNLGRLDEAAQMQQEWIAYAKQRASSRPEDAVASRYVASAYVELGDTFYQQPEKALDAEIAYGQSAAIYRDLVARDRTNKNYGFALCGGQMRVGDALFQQGDLEGAMRQYGAARALCRELSLSDPSVFVWRQRHGITWQ